MSLPVFAWTMDYEFEFEREFEEVNVEIGGGVFRSALSEIPHSRADGQGTISAYKGTNYFTVVCKRKNYAGDEQFKAVLAFLQARKEENNGPFYFYAPWERTTPDLTGVDTTGRYIVRFRGKIAATLTHMKIFNFASLRFEEDRSQY